MSCKGQTNLTGLRHATLVSGASLKSKTIERFHQMLRISGCQPGYNCWPYLHSTHSHFLESMHTRLRGNRAERRILQPHSDATVADPPSHLDILFQKCKRDFCFLADLLLCSMVLSSRKGWGSDVSDANVRYISFHSFHLKKENWSRFPWTRGSPETLQSWLAVADRRTVGHRRPQLPVVTIGHFCHR